MSASYDHVGSRAAYVYELAPNSTLVAPQQLEPVRNRLHTAATDVRHPQTARLVLGVGYRFEHCDVEDFARSPGTLDSALIPTFMNLMTSGSRTARIAGFCG